MSQIKNFIVETLLYGFANVFSRFFAMLLIPIFTSYLVKEDYANFVMLQTLFSLLTFFLALNSGVFFYYYEYDKIKYRKIVFSTWFYYQLGVAFLILLLLFFTSPTLTNYFVINETNYDTIKWCLILVGVQLFPYIINITNINLFRINREPKKVILIVFFESLLTLLMVYISLKYFNSGLIGIVLAQILSRLLIALFFTKTTSFYWSLFNFSKKLLGKIFAYSWPFIVSSVFSVLLSGADKFIGASLLTNKEDVAILALAAQLVIPIVVLADMIRMAIGPFVMSIRKQDDANSTYQSVYDLSIFTGSIVLIGLVAISPVLTLLLADKSYIKVIEIIPLFALANVISLAYLQFSISINLVKKNIYIMYAVVLGGTSGILINFLFMNDFGFIISGYSQLFSYLIMSVFLYFIGRKIANQDLKIKNSLIIFSILISYIILINFFTENIYKNEYLVFISISFVCILLIAFIYMKQHQVSIGEIFLIIKNKISPKKSV
ncbi:MAG TPA: oligosaccharide flippase family protein [Crocinitomicaceae bacterium]|nr:oligosaccharide flippase family protein [Crocinitomicaceae bacterium]